jgi:heme oxygenase (biliverdin-IX-beta and delta-forming)
LPDLQRRQLSEELRDGAKVAHQRLEDALSPVLAALDLRSYRELLRAFHDFIGPWQERLQAKAGPLHARWRADRHLQRLRADLEVVDAPAPSPVARPVLPRIDSVAAALGSLYVIEGSMLGGRIISRRVDAALGFTPAHGCRYFAAYGDDVGSGWVRFRSELDGMADARERCMALRAARRTFVALHAWLRRRGVVA